MTTEYRKFWDWLEFDEDSGDIIGIRKDAPRQMKLDYEAYLKEKKKAKKENIKL